MSENMKPCPWCGQTDKLEVETSNTEFMWVTCTRCGILGPQHGYTRELAIGCWNRRMREDDLAEALEGFVEWVQSPLAYSESERVERAVKVMAYALASLAKARGEQ